MGHQDEEEAWSSNPQAGGGAGYYPAQTQYTYAYSNPPVQGPGGMNQQQPQAGGVGMGEQYVRYLLKY